jgi:hypothetical protein
MDLDEPGTTTGLLHPQTSFDAAECMRVNSGTARRRVLEALAARDLTDEEVQAILAMSPNTQRPRRVELVRAGYVEATDLRRLSVSGCRSIVWTATIAGRIALARTL